MFIGVLLMFTLLDPCSTRVHSYSLVFIGVLLVFIGVHWCSTRVHWCSLVFIDVHSCSHSCGVLDWIVCKCQDITHLKGVLQFR